MFTNKLFKPLPLLIVTMFLILWPLYNHVYSQEIKTMDQLYTGEHKKQEMQNCSKRSDLNLDFSQGDLLLNLLGKSFTEIKELLGEPEEQGYSSWYGPHDYMLFNLEKGPIYFSSPENAGNQLAVNIIAGGEQEILGVRVGMTFAEIQAILGPPAYGPEPGMDNLYYMEYFFGETASQPPDLFISFSADDIISPTRDAFIKWESFEYGKVE